jgi:hypothetical protein
MRAFLQLAVLVTDDPSQLQKLIDRNKVVDDSSSTASTFHSGTVTLAPSASAAAVSFGGVTNASVLYVEADGEIQLQLDSNSAPLVPVRPTPAQPAASVLSEFQLAAQPGLVFWRGKITSLYATNPSSTASATFRYALIGEAA